MSAVYADKSTGEDEKGTAFLTAERISALQKDFFRTGFDLAEGIFSFYLHEYIDVRFNVQRKKTEESLYAIACF